MSRLELAILAALSLFAACDACDCSGARSDASADASETSEAAAPEPPGDPLEVRGSVTATAPRGGESRELLWKHAFDANDLIAATRCDRWFYAVTAAGRLLRFRMGETTVDGAFAEPYGLTAIHGTDEELVLGTRTGRLFRSDCELSDAKEAEERSWAVSFVHRDPRASDRVLAALEEPTPDGGVETTIVNTLLDLKTGKSTTDAFEFTVDPDTRLIHFVDYKGELWAGAASSSGSRLWYLERFDHTQPRVAKIGRAHELRGLSQVGRRVWAYGTSRETGRGFVYRVDSGTPRRLFDGEKIATGQHAGGEVPEAPLTLVIQRGEHVIVFSPGAIYRADQELRRWKKLVSSDTGELFERVVGWAREDDTYVLATSRGIAVYDHEEQTLSHESQPTVPAPPSDATLSTSVNWRGSRYIASDEGLTTIGERDRTARPIFDVDAPTHALSIDGLDRLWIVTQEEVLVVHVADQRPAVERFPLEKVGIPVEELDRFWPTERSDVVAMDLGRGGRFRLRLPQRQTIAADAD